LALEAVKRALPAGDATTVVSMAAALATLMRLRTAIPTTSAQATFAHNLGVPPLAYKTAPVAPPTRRAATPPPPHRFAALLTKVVVMCRRGHDARKWPSRTPVPSIKMFRYP
jgi:hypothetical protein